MAAVADDGLGGAKRAGSGPVYRVLTSLIAVASLGGFGYLIYQSLGSDGAEIADDAPVPVIHAATTDFKVVPDDPGGMAPPTPGITIFDDLMDTPLPRDGEESLLPAPELPIVNPTLDDFAEQEVDIVPLPAPAVTAPDEPQTDIAALIAQSELAGGLVVPPVLSQPLAPLPSLSDASFTPASQEPAAVEDATASDDLVQALGPRVQLGALRSQDAAMSEWQRLSRVMSDLIGRYNPAVQISEFDDRGVFYRLQIPVNTAVDAAALCSMIKDRGHECLVITD